MPRGKKMSVTLSPHLEAIVRDHVATGDFADADEVVAEALRLLDEYNLVKLERLRAAVATGFEQIERGEGREYTPEVYAEILANARRKIREGHRPNPDVLP